MSARRDISHHEFLLGWLSEPFTIHRLSHDAAWPEFLKDAWPVFVARTADEVSVICPAALAIDSDQSAGPYRAMRVMGELEFDLVGVIAGLTEVLAAAQISVLTVSTFKTDYVFVREAVAEFAEAALRAAGYLVSG